MSGAYHYRPRDTSRLPVRSPQGFTLALVSKQGLHLWNKRTCSWEIISLEILVQLQGQCTEPDQPQHQQHAS